jgi:hypothetical protein
MEVVSGGKLGRRERVIVGWGRDGEDVDVEGIGNFWVLGSGFREF